MERFGFEFILWGLFFGVLIVGSFLSHWNDFFSARRLRAFKTERGSALDGLHYPRNLNTKKRKMLVGMLNGRRVEIRIAGDRDFTIEFVVPSGPAMEIARRRAQSVKDGSSDFAACFEVSMTRTHRDPSEVLSPTFQDLLTAYAQAVDDAIHISIQRDTFTLVVKGKPDLTESDVATFDRAVELVKAFSEHRAIDRVRVSEETVDTTWDSEVVW
jgi:hypothetical protein